MYKDRSMKSKEGKTNHSNEIINQDLNPKTMFDQSREFSLWDLIKPHGIHYKARIDDP